MDKSIIKAGDIITVDVKNKGNDTDFLFSTNLQEEIISKLVKIEEEILIKVLRRFLNREPEINDFKKCTRIFEPHKIDRYFLQFDGVVIGKIVKKYGIEQTITFNPT